MTTSLTRRSFAAALALTGACAAWPVLAQDAELPAEPIVIADMTLGSADAPIEMIEYASYTCSHCAAFHADQFQMLKEQYIDTGKLRFTHREAIFDRAVLWATMVARCGGEMRYWGMSGLIYEQQHDWIGDRTLAGISDRLRTLGLTAGLEPEQLDACLQDAATAQALVDWSETNTTEDDISATPTLIINGTTYANMSSTDLAAVLDGLLED